MDYFKEICVSNGCLFDVTYMSNKLVRIVTYCEIVELKATYFPFAYEGTKLKWIKRY